MNRKRLVITLAIVALIMVAVVPLASAAAPETAREFKVSINKGKSIDPSQLPSRFCPDRSRFCPDGSASCGCSGNYFFKAPVSEATY